MKGNDYQRIKENIEEYFYTLSDDAVPLPIPFQPPTPTLKISIIDLLVYKASLTGMPAIRRL